jgi:GNAT superfamily N-acetyltransferase
MLTFQELTQENLPHYAGCLLHSEYVFPDPIKFTQEDYLEILLGQEYIAKIALIDGSYAGNIVGADLHPVEIEEHGIGSLTQNEKMIYLYGFVLEPEHQGKGYGFKLLTEFLKTARSRGYTSVVGHFRQNASLALMRKLGCDERAVEKDWCGTGEDFVFCSLDLRSLPQGK